MSDMDELMTSIDMDDFLPLTTPELADAPKTPEHLIPNIIESREENKIYVSDFKDDSGKYISMYIKDMQVSSQIQVSLSYIKKNGITKGVEITRVKKGNPDGCIKLTLDGYAKLIQVLDFLKSIDYPTVQNHVVSLHDTKISVDEQTKSKIKTMLLDSTNQDFLEELISDNYNKVIFSDKNSTQSIIEALDSGLINTQDIVNVGYRRTQLKTFENMLSGTHDEKDWQKFFEKNQWIFGYGLDYKFNTILQREYSTGSQGLDAKGDQRGDFILKNAEFTVLVELKTPSTELLGKDTYRAGCWKISNDLADATSQVLAQKYEAMNNFKNITEDCEDQVHFYDAKAILIVGNSSQFDAGDNKEKRLKKRTFELYRRNLRNVEIITYDELYERAQFIVQYKNNK